MTVPLESTLFYIFYIVIILFDTLGVFEIYVLLYAYYIVCNINITALVVVYNITIIINVSTWMGDRLCVYLGDVVRSDPNLCYLL